MHNNVFEVKAYLLNNTFAEYKCHHCLVHTDKNYYSIFFDHSPLLLILKDAVIELYDVNNLQTNVISCEEGIFNLKNNDISIFFIK